MLQPCRILQTKPLKILFSVKETAEKACNEGIQCGDFLLSCVGKAQPYPSPVGAELMRPAVIAPSDLPILSDSEAMVPDDDFPTGNHGTTSRLVGK